MHYLTFSFLNFEDKMLSKRRRNSTGLNQVNAALWCLPEVCCQLGETKLWVLCWTNFRTAQNAQSYWTQKTYYWFATEFTRTQNHQKPAPPDWASSVKSVNVVTSHRTFFPDHPTLRTRKEPNSGGVTSLMFTRARMWLRTYMPWWPDVGEFTTIDGSILPFTQPGLEKHLWLRTFSDHRVTMAILP